MSRKTAAPPVADKPVRIRPLTDLPAQPPGDHTRTAGSFGVALAFALHALPRGLRTSSELRGFTRVASRAFGFTYPSPTAP